jgi:DNA-binding NarL/FixJ family response regulator
MCSFHSTELVSGPCARLTLSHMEQAPKIQVMIANDQNLVREGLAAVLNRQKDIRVVAQTGKISQVVDYFERHRPNVLLIDLRLGGSDTIETIKTICEKHPAAAILMVSEYDGSEDIYRALRAGARGYVLKDVSDSEIVEAIRTLSSGRNHISPQIAARLAERMNKSTLTRRELEVLQFIVKGKSNKEIADTLNVTEATVKYHVNGILSKLGVTDRTQAATAALLRGIIHPQDL